MSEHRQAGQRITIMCIRGDLVIEAPHARGVSIEPLRKPAGWVLRWTAHAPALGDMSQWTERLTRLEPIHGVKHLSRAAALLRTGDMIAAMQEAALLPEPYIPIWALIRAEVSRRV